MVKFARTHPDALVPTKGSQYAAGWDLYSLEDTEVPFRSTGTERNGHNFELLWNGTERNGSNLRMPRTERTSFQLTFIVKLKFHWKIFIS